MNSDTFRGFWNVCTFTFAQAFKSKAIKIVTIIIFLVALLGTPVYSLFSGNSEEKEKSKSDVDIIYVVDENGSFHGSIKKILGESVSYKTTEFVNVNSIEEARKDLNDCEKPCVIMELKYGQEGINIRYVYDDESNVDAFTVQSLSSDVEDSMQDIIYDAMDITEDSIRLIKEPVNSNITYIKNESNQSGDDSDENTVVSNKVYVTMSQYTISFIFVMIVIFILSFGGEAVASSIVTEKSSKVIEILLINIKPVGIVTGKVIAMLGVVLCQFFAGVIGFLGSMFITNSMFGKSPSEVLPKSLGESMSGLNTDALDMTIKILVILVVLIAGIILFGLLAGMFGAMISKIEQLAEGMKTYSLIMIVCAYVGLGITIAANSSGVPMIVLYIAAIFPLSSVFIVPGFLIMGKLPLWIAVISALVLVASVYLLLKITTAIYEYLIYYNGSAMSLKKLFSLLKGKKNKEVR